MLLRTGRWLFVAAFAMIFSAHAQETRSTVLGRISDPTGAVIPGAVVEATNLDTGVRAMVPTNANGDFLLKEPCEVHFQDADVADPSHPLNVVKLPVALKSGFSVDPAAPNAIAKVPIMKGTMTAVLYPHSSPNNPEASVITQVDVPHTGNIQVQVKSVASGVVRTITLKPGTEIAVVNDLDPVIKECLSLHGGINPFCL